MLELMCVTVVLSLAAPQPPFELREMDMHLHAGLEREVPLKQWIDLAAADGRKAIVLLDHLELYRQSPSEYEAWANEHHFQQWYPVRSEGHKALMADFDRAAAEHKDLLLFKGWEIGEFELDEGLETAPMALAEVIGWHISPNHKGTAPDGKHLLHRIQQVKEVQKRFPVPMILFHPFSMRLEHLVEAAQKAGRKPEELTVEECRFFKPGEQDKVVREFQGTSIYIEMSSGTTGYWKYPAMREALIADVRPLADAGVHFTVSTDNHTVGSARTPFYPEVYCAPCGITADNANGVVRELLERRAKQNASERR